MKMMSLRKGLVRTDALGDKTYECYLENGNWNGWACPWFEEKVADEICKDVNADITSHLKLDKFEFSDCVPIYNEYDFAGLPDVPCEYKSCNMEVDGQTKILVPLGTGVWCWEEVEE